MNRLTALIIQNEDNDIRCEASQVTKTKKWCGLICHYRNGTLHQGLVETAAVYDTGEIAVAEMEKIVKKIREDDSVQDDSVP